MKEPHPIKKYTAQVLECSVHAKNSLRLRSQRRKKLSHEWRLFSILDVSCSNLSLTLSTHALYTFFSHRYKSKMRVSSSSFFVLLFSEDGFSQGFHDKPCRRLLSILLSPHHLRNERWTHKSIIDRKMKNTDRKQPVPPLSPKINSTETSIIQFRSLITKWKMKPKPIFSHSVTLLQIWSNDRQLSAYDVHTHILTCFYYGSKNMIST